MPLTAPVATDHLAADAAKYSAVLGPQGRIVIPSELRKELNLEPGTILTIWSEGGGVYLRSRAAARESAKQLFRDARARLGERSLVDELIAERRGEAARELTDEG